MSQNFSSTQHLSAAALATAPPFWVAVWFTTTGGQFRRFFTLGDPANANNVMGLVTDVTGPTNNLSVYESTVTPTAVSTQQTTSAVNVSGGWNHGIAVFSSTSLRSVYLNGSNKAVSQGIISTPPVSLSVVSGRHTDFTSGTAGNMAHLAFGNGSALTDAQAFYLGTGGNPRALKNCTNYYKISAAGGVPESPVVDQIGTLNLTSSSPGPTAGTVNPDIETFMTGGPVGNLSYTQGSPITSIDCSAGKLFDDVSSSFTVSLRQLGTPTSPTTTTAAGTAQREIPVASVTGLVADNYIKVAGNTTPTRILAVNVTALTVLVDKDQTYVSGATVSYYTVNPLTLAGLSFTGNVFSGTPTAPAVNNLCLFRATCNNNASIVADSDVITITIAASGGGAGSSLLSVAGSYCGGFTGG